MKTLVIYSNLDGFAVQLKNHLEDALSELAIEWKECYITDFFGMSESFQPTMNLFFHPNNSLREYFSGLSEVKGHKLFWTHEDPYESDLTFEALDHFYYVFTSDKNTAEHLKKEGKANEIQFVPHACNPKVHRPMEVDYEHRSDIAFIGNAYESRLEYLKTHAEEYKEKMFTLIGVGYRGLDGYQNQRVIHGHINEEEMVKYINGAKFVLNLHRQNTDLDMANSKNIQASSYNNRFYETWACGKKQLVWGREEPFIHEENYLEAHEKHSYKARLLKYYLPLLKGIGR